MCSCSQREARALLTRVRRNVNVQEGGCIAAYAWQDTDFGIYDKLSDKIGGCPFLATVSLVRLWGSQAQTASCRAAAAQVLPQSSATACELKVGLPLYRPVLGLKAQIMVIT